MPPHDDETRVVTAGAQRFRVVERGPDHGPPVILLHGFPQSASAWDRVAPVLAAGGARTIAFDQRGYSPGARPEDAAAYRLSEVAGDVLAVAEAAGLERFHVVGHDWGGAVAWELASSHPDRLLTATSVSTPHPAALRASMSRSLQPLRSAYIALFVLPAVPERILLAQNGAVLRRLLERSGLPPEDAAEYTGRMCEPGALAAALNWYRANLSLGATPPGPARVPTLYVWSDRDSALGPAAARATVDYVDAPYRFEVLRGASHWIPETRADELAALILAHIHEPAAP